MQPPPMVDPRQVSQAIGGENRSKDLFKVAQVADRAIDWTKSAWASVSDGYQRARHFVTGEIKNVAYKAGNEGEVNATTKGLTRLASQVTGKWEKRVRDEGLTPDLRAEVRRDYLSHVAGAEGASEKKFASGILTSTECYDRIRQIDHSAKLLGQGEKLASTFVIRTRKKGFSEGTPTTVDDAPADYATFKYNDAGGHSLEVSVSGKSEMVIRQGRKVYGAEVDSRGETHFYRYTGREDGKKASKLTTSEIVNHADTLNREEITRKGLVRTGTKHLSRIVDEFNETHRASAQLSEVRVWAKGAQTDSPAPGKPTIRLSGFRWREKDGASATAYRYENGKPITGMGCALSNKCVLELPNEGKIYAPKHEDFSFQAVTPNETVQQSARRPHAEKAVDAGQDTRGRLKASQARVKPIVNLEADETITADKIGAAFERWSLATRMDDPVSRVHYETYTKLDNAARSMGWTKPNQDGGGETLDDRKLYNALATVMEANKDILGDPFIDAKDGAKLIRSMRQFKSLPQYGTNLAKAFVERSREKGQIDLTPDGSKRLAITKPDQEIAVEFCRFLKALNNRVPMKWVDEAWEQSRREVVEESMSPHKRVERALIAAKLDTGKVQDNLTNAARDVGWDYATHTSDAVYVDEEKINDCLGALLEGNREILSKPEVDAKDGEKILAQMRTFKGYAGKNFGEAFAARMKGRSMEDVLIKEDGSRERVVDAIPNEGIALDFAQYMKKVYDQWQKEDTT